MAEVTTPLGRDLAGAFPGLRVSVDEADRTLYSRDLWPRHHMDVRGGHPSEHRPAVIAWPSSTAHVSELVRWARERGVAIVPFGAGSGVCAGILPRQDAIVVDLKRMSAIRALEREGPWVDVEAGHMGVPFEESLGRAGLTLGHFPSSILCSTVGGWIATRSAGQCSGAYGKIEDMVVALECVTGAGDVVELKRRTSAPDLVPLMVGSEGTMAVVTSARLRLHPAPTTRSFGAWSLPSTRLGWEAMRALFQEGLRPAVARLYDPFDAMLAKKGGVRSRQSGGPKERRGFGGAALRAVLRRPGALNELLYTDVAARVLGGAMLVVVFEGDDGAVGSGLDRARAIVEPMGGVWEGEGPARRWLAHRYAVSYRQAPVFAQGGFVDTMEVAARWSRLGALYEAVRSALGPSVFVMAHFSHAYPDGCSIYFSFAGSADPGLVRTLGWEGACEATYDRAWRTALSAAIEAGGTLSHHHGVGRSKAPRISSELGSGVHVVRSLLRAFDPAGILNPGNLVPAEERASARPTEKDRAKGERPAFELDRESLLAGIEGSIAVSVVEDRLKDAGLTLDAGSPPPATSVADWLAEGAPGSRDRWLDPVDQRLAGLDATLGDGLSFSVRPAPRRAVGPDLAALLIGARHRYGRIDRAWLRVHRVGATAAAGAAFHHERDPALSSGEGALLDDIDRALR